MNQVIFANFWTQVWATERPKMGLYKEEEKEDEKKREKKINLKKQKKKRKVRKKKKTITEEEEEPSAPPYLLGFGLGVDFCGLLREFFHQIGVGSGSFVQQLLQFFHRLRLSEMGY